MHKTANGLASRARWFARPLASLAQGAWSSVWPERCMVCSADLSRGTESSLCPECQATVRPIEQPACAICGAQLASHAAPAGGVCGHCRLRRPPFDMARAYGAYAGALGFMVRKFKYNGRRDLLPALRSLILAADELFLDEVEADVAIPIPLHPARLRERGYNQAADLARAVAGQRGIRLDLDSLTRAKNTAPQFGLTIAQRRDNVKGAFKVTRPGRIEDRAVILIDDVITTGATAGEAAKTLKKHKASAVIVLSVARAI